MRQLIKWILVSWFILFGGAIVISNAFAYTLTYTLYNTSSSSVPDSLVNALPYFVSGSLTEPRGCIGSQRVLMEEFDLQAHSGRALFRVDRQGNVWTAPAFKKAIIRFNPFTGDKTVFTLKLDSLPVSIFLAKDGCLYYTDVGRNAIGQLNPENGVLKEFYLPLK